MRKKPDGSVIPSTLSTKPLPDARSFLTQNHSLKMGVVTDIIYPEEDKSLSKRFIEYNVMSSEISEGGTNLTVYRNCTVNNQFGMSNNNSTYTLQAEKAEDGKIEFASLVLIMCISGQSSNGQAVILGGFSHPDNPKHSKADGQFYDFNFNGINYNINKDGEWTVTFNSPLDSKKNKKNPKAAGTAVKIDKEGRVKISDNEGQFWELDRVAQKSTWSNGSEFIIIDKKNKKIEMNSAGEMSSTSTKKMSLTSSDNIEASASKDAKIKAGANVSLEAKSNMNQKSGGNWEVKATGDVNVVAGGAVTLKAPIVAVQGQITTLGAGGLPVGIAGISICQGIGNLGIPVISTILTGSGTVLAGS